MSIEKITSAIIHEAAAQKEQILNAADIKSRSIIRELENRIEIETAVAVKEAEEEREKIINRRKSVADIDSKKIVLAKKQELINACFERAVDAILSMEESRYVDFLAAAGKASGFTEGTLIFNEKEKDAIGYKVMAAIEQSVPGGRFQVSQETRRLRGGYMLQKGQIYINNSVEAMVEEKRQELTAEVAAILFPPEE